MIYSMTMYFNEDELVDLKIKEESPYVDKIVVSESYWTHAGHLKPIRFPAYKYDSKKVEHLIISDDSIYEPEKQKFGNLYRAVAERKYPARIYDIKDDDILIVADIDEIVNGEQIPRIVEQTRRNGFVRLGMRGFYYYINVKQADEWGYPYAATGKMCKKADLNWLRLQAMGPTLPGCGNHFGWLGGPEKIRIKIENMGHTEFNTPDVIEGIEDRMKNLDDVVARKNLPPLTIIDIDDFHPRTIRENLSEWEKYICKR